MSLRRRAEPWRRRGATVDASTGTSNRDMKYDARAQWTNFYLEKGPGGKTYPNEFLVRIFKGRYPRLDLDKSRYHEQKACDLGCGDGRNLVLLHDLGLETHGVEITPEVADWTRRRLREVENIDVDIRVGTNDNFPFEDDSLDYLVSWWSCYYMGQHEDFGIYVEEFARALKPGGYFVANLVKPSHLAGYSESVRLGCYVLRNDPVEIRNGEVFRAFEDEEDVRMQFGEHFDRFIFGSQHDDSFGVRQHAWVVVCQKKG